LAMERSNEMVEVAMSDIANQLKLADTAQIVVLNARTTSPLSDYL
jgi:hypothetical protein